MPLKGNSHDSICVSKIPFEKAFHSLFMILTLIIMANVPSPNEIDSDIVDEDGCAFFVFVYFIIISSRKLT
jgi:hypothetical protein